MGDRVNGFTVHDAVMLRLDPQFGGGVDPYESHIGGPLVTGADEIVGVVVGETQRGYLVVQPWKALDECIDMAGLAR